MSVFSALNRYKIGLSQLIEIATTYGIPLAVFLAFHL